MQNRVQVESPLPRRFDDGCHHHPADARTATGRISPVPWRCAPRPGGGRCRRSTPGSSTAWSAGRGTGPSVWDGHGSSRSTNLPSRGLSSGFCTATANPLGYVHLQPQPAEDGTEVEMRYFGLGEAAIGRGLGGPLLEHGIRATWTLHERTSIAAVSQVWVHTCTPTDPPPSRTTRLGSSSPPPRKPTRISPNDRPDHGLPRRSDSRALSGSGVRRSMFQSGFGSA